MIDLGGTDAPGGDKATASESRSCPGYKLIRRFKADGTIGSYRPVVAEPGWDCEYSVNDGVGVVAFKGTNEALEVQFIAGGTTSTLEASNLERDVEDELSKLGFEGK